MLGYVETPVNSLVMNPMLYFCYKMIPLLGTNVTWNITLINEALSTTPKDSAGKVLRVRKENSVNEMGIFSYEDKTLPSP